MKTIRKLFGQYPYKLITGSAETKILGISYDSRNVKPGDLFVCLRGFNSDGHAYAKMAAEKGASAILIDKDFPEIEPAVPSELLQKLSLIQVTDSRACLPRISAEFFDNPSSSMTMVGVTGTKGKTTTTHMIKAIIEEAGIKVGMVGTNGAYFGSEYIETKNTTPESYELHSIFAKMRDAGCKIALMEVSSQATKTHRIDGINFEIGAFTNLYPDHISPGEHADFNEYKACKKAFFKQVKTIVTNAGDPYGLEMAEGFTHPVTISARPVIASACSSAASVSARPDIASSYSSAASVSARPDIASSYSSAASVSARPDLCAADITQLWENDYLGVSFNLVGDINSPARIGIPGSHNVENALIAAEVALQLGIDKASILRGLEKAKVKGRTQYVPEAASRGSFIIDYAHNGVSTENLLKTLKAYNPKKLTCVFGCGGNRAPARRLEMGAAAAKYADYIVITTDNPRFEELDDINKGIIDGINGACPYEIIKDRAEAIRHMLDISKPGEMVALMGKGHESYIEVKAVRTHFSEEEVIKSYFEAK